MTPRVISNFVTMLCDLGGAISMVIHESSCDEERAAGMRVRKGCDQVVETLGLGSRIERERDLVLAAWATIDLAKLSPFLALRGAVLLVEL